MDENQIRLIRLELKDSLDTLYQQANNCQGRWDIMAEILGTAYHQAYDQHVKVIRAQQRSDALSEQFWGGLLTMVVAGAGVAIVSNLIQGKLGARTASLNRIVGPAPRKNAVTYQAMANAKKSLKEAKYNTTALNILEDVLQIGIDKAIEFERALKTATPTAVSLKPYQYKSAMRLKIKTDFQQALELLTTAKKNIDSASNEKIEKVARQLDIAKYRKHMASGCGQYVDLHNIMNANYVVDKAWQKRTLAYTQKLFATTAWCYWFLRNCFRANDFGGPVYNPPPEKVRDELKRLGILTQAGIKRPWAISVTDAGKLAKYCKSWRIPSGTIPPFFQVLIPKAGKAPTKQ